MLNSFPKFKKEDFLILVSVKSGGVLLKHKESQAVGFHKDASCKEENEKLALQKLVRTEKFKNWSLSKNN